MKPKYILLILLCIQLSSCRKWLDVKSNISDVTPTTIADYQAIIDNDLFMNLGSPALPLLSSDNYYVTYTTWQARSATERNAYIWASEVFEGTTPNDWSYPYRIVELSNTVIEGLNKIPVTTANQTQWNNLKGSALFLRAFSFYNLLQAFAPPYITATAGTDPGIPVRLTTDVNERSERASIQEVYDRIMLDLKESVDLLPVTPAFQTRPSKTAAQALLAKVYLNIGDNAQALDYSDRALTSYKTLIDFNTLNAAATFAFPVYPGNSEIIFYNTSIFYLMMSNAISLVDSTLYQSYATNDLRKTIFYRLNVNLPIFKGSYTGKISTNFSGLATNETYLIRAEANARLGNTAAAITDLNTLMLKRWKTGTFVPFTAITSADALTKILTERRKELPFTGSTRWEDLRRLNQDTRFATTLTRQLNSQAYVLAPNNAKYVFPIPDDEIRLSGIKQNPR